MPPFLFGGELLAWMAIKGGPMPRYLPAVLVLATIAAPAGAAPPVGKRTTTPAQILGAMGQTDPEAELRQQVAAASAHPLGTIDNPVRAGGPEGERFYLGAC